MSPSMRKALTACASSASLLLLMGCAHVCTPRTDAHPNEEADLNRTLDTVLIGAFGIIGGKNDAELGIDGRDYIVATTHCTLYSSDGQAREMIHVPVSLWFYRASVAAKRASGAATCVPILIDSRVAARWRVPQEPYVGPDKERKEFHDAVDVNASFRDVLTLICERSGGLQWRIAKGSIIVEEKR